MLSDNLLSNLVQQAVEWDKTDNHNKPPSLRTDAHLNALVKCINGCGVCFSVWEKKNADGKSSGTFDFTSLMGSDKKLLLENLPDKLGGVIFVFERSKTSPKSAMNAPRANLKRPSFYSPRIP